MAKIKTKLKTYNDITDFSKIARRYFINNFYDGELTILGIIMAWFVYVLNPAQPTIPSSFIILPGIGTAISMFISGVSGSYLSEKAEQKKSHSDLELAMGRARENGPKEVLDIIKEEEEIKKAMLKNVDLKNNSDKYKTKKQKKIRTIHEKAERFAGLVVAIVNGGAPFLGGVIPLIPFVFVSNVNVIIFIISFVITAICIVGLAIYLGNVSKDSIIKNILQMILVFLITFILIFFVVFFLG